MSLQLQKLRKTISRVSLSAKGTPSKHTSHAASSNDNSPDTAPPNDSHIPENILAFRTITTILSKIQQTTSFKYTTVKPSSKEERQELRVLNALATIMVMNHEVVAVVTNQSDVPGKLEVVICRNLIKDREKLTGIINPQPELQRFGEFWQIFANKNPRKSEDGPPALPRPKVTMVDPKVPSGLEGEGKEDLRNFVRNVW